MRKNNLMTKMNKNIMNIGYFLIVLKYFFRKINYFLIKYLFLSHNIAQCL